MFKKLRAFEAPSNFIFIDPDTGFKFQASTRESLVRHILAYREQNQLEPIEALNVVLENYWCNLPENAGKCQDNRSLDRSWYAYIKGGIALLENLMYPEKASQEEADKRAEQCVKCPHNVFPDKGPFLLYSDNIAIACVGDKRSKHHDELGNCQVCSCPLRAKVFWNKKMSEFPKDQLEKLKEVNCWQLKLSGQS